MITLVSILTPRDFTFSTSCCNYFVFSEDGTPEYHKQELRRLCEEPRRLLHRNPSLQDLRRRSVRKDRNRSLQLCVRSSVQPDTGLMPFSRRPVSNETLQFTDGNSFALAYRGYIYPHTVSPEDIHVRRQPEEHWTHR